MAGNRHKNYGSTASNDSANGATEKKSLGSESSSGGKRESFSDSFGASYAAARYNDASKDIRDENTINPLLMRSYYSGSVSGKPYKIHLKDFFLPRSVL